MAFNVGVVSSRRFLRLFVYYGVRGLPAPTAAGRHQVSRGITNQEVPCTICFMVVMLSNLGV